MKKTNVLLLALLAFVCLFAVSCDGEPANPANPVNPGKPDDQPVTPPSETSVIDQKIKAYLQVMDFFDELKFEGIGEDKDAFLRLFRNDDGTYREDEKEALLGLAFAKEGKADSLLDDAMYLEINGERYCLSSSSSDNQKISDYSIENVDVSSVSVNLDKMAGTLNISVVDLTFTAKIIAPVEHSIEIRMSADMSVYVKDEDGRLVWDETNPFDFDVTMDGDQWPHFKVEFSDFMLYYGEHERSLAYTITFDSNGGSDEKPLKVPFVGAKITSNVLPSPTKEGSVFKEWVTKDGIAIGASEFEVTEDITLYAVYEDSFYYELDMEPFFAIYQSFQACARFGKDSVDETTDINELFGDINASDNLNRVYFLLLAVAIEGYVDSFGGEPYLCENENDYYVGTSDDNPSILSGGFEIKNAKVDSFSVVFNQLDVKNGTKTVKVRNLEYDVEINIPSKQVLHVDLSADIVFNVHNEDGYDWTMGEDDGYQIDISIANVPSPTFKYDVENSRITYGDDTYELFTVTFFDDKDKGRIVNSQRVVEEESPIAPCPPSRVGALFMEWRNFEDDEPYDFDEVYEDMELYAVYYTPAPSSLEGEIYATYKLADYFSFMNMSGAISFEGLFDGVNVEEALLDIAFLIKGKTSGFGKDAVITIGGTEYTSAMVKSEFDFDITNWSLESKWGINSTDKDDIVGKSRNFDGLSYAVTIKNKDDDSIVETLNVSLSFGRVDVKPCDDPAYLNVEVWIDDGAGGILDRSLELFGDDEYGYYSNDDGDYYFDSTKYPKIELKK